MYSTRFKFIASSLFVVCLIWGIRLANNNNFSLRSQTLKFAVDPAEQGCVKQNTCNKCITVKGNGGKPVCGFNKSSQCVGQSTASPASLAKTPAECKIFEDEQKQEHEKDAEFTKNAQKEWEKIKPHVFGTEKGLKNTSGRHLASSLLSVPANKKNLKRTEYENAGLSMFVSPSKKIKTTWDDDLGRYTPTQVEVMCVAAIKAVLKMNDSKTLPSGMNVISISVPSPRGMNLCISVQGNTSVFPGSTGATNVAIGQACVPDAGAVDDIE
ncbi:hypothetical protein E1B28_010423 [Marasmius oreades]|uniref:Uncharacterized protein n=1 Tax=Marasmius oreades TaxID=181124 RepID=A0A9P7URR7_9AGAR|nr:uncharacterized protein E1B28_010423 [Marasmius oreades]KAG7091385.1 hypothetical protein E1B28_010423 [Marasmius oreades]